jgi:hypothetical protein
MKWQSICGDWVKTANCHGTSKIFKIARLDGAERQAQLIHGWKYQKQSQL